MILYSLKTIGSKEFQQQILKDIEDLLKTCHLEKLIPLYLVVGRSFLEISCVQHLKNELNIEDWDSQLNKEYNTLSEMFHETRLNTVRKCEENYGIFDLSEELVIYFDPEEEYLSIHAIDESIIKKKKKRKIDKDCIQILRYEKDEILTDFNPEFIHQ